MSRTSCDQYKLPSGVIVNIVEPHHLEDVLKDGGTLYNGYNYDEQKWYYQGAPDTRTFTQCNRCGKIVDASTLDGRQICDDCIEASNKPCPACHGPLQSPEVMNSLSRYCGSYICSGCGMREAFEGFFWQSKAI